MVVYIKSKEDWVNFVNGQEVVVFRNPVEGYFKQMLVSSIEVVSDDGEELRVVKKY
jgi:hypothetical protein